jgi:hypothetical protein
LAQQLTEDVEAYLLKPIDINQLIEQVWHLMCLSNKATVIPIRRWEEIEGFAPNLFPSPNQSGEEYTVYLPGIQSGVFNQNPVKLLRCAAGVN